MILALLIVVVHRHEGHLRPYPSGVQPNRERWSEYFAGSEIFAARRTDRGIGGVVSLVWFVPSPPMVNLLCLSGVQRDRERRRRKLKVGEKLLGFGQRQDRLSESRRGRLSPISARRRAARGL